MVPRTFNLTKAPRPFLAMRMAATGRQSSRSDSCGSYGLHGFAPFEPPYSRVALADFLLQLLNLASTGGYGAITYGPEPGLRAVATQFKLEYSALVLHGSVRPAV